VYDLVALATRARREARGMTQREFDVPTEAILPD
jgi:hypothetical protein